jgi:hypothetical protein
MFGDLIYDTIGTNAFKVNKIYFNGDVPVISWHNAHLGDDNFRNYIKSWELQPFKDYIESQL